MNDTTREIHGYFAETEYEVFKAFPGMNPSRMRFLAALKGVDAPDFAKPFRYLELGCGQGYGLLMFAALYPTGHFHGVDFMASQIARAIDLTTRTGLTNIEFTAASFEDFAAGEGDGFDVIALHGVWTWVGPQAQAQILEIISKRLNPGGFVYVSANMAPGWAQVAPYQSLVLSLKRAMPGAPPREIVDRFKAICATDTPLARVSAHGLKKLLKGLGSTESYFVHEYFNEAWRPVSFNELVQSFGAAGLQFVSSSRPVDVSARLRCDDALRAILGSLNDPVEREAVRSNLLAESFRADFFARDARALTQAEQMQRLAATPIGLVNEKQTKVATIRVMDSEVAIDNDLRKAFVEVLSEGPCLLSDLAGLPVAAAKGLPVFLDTVLAMMATEALEVGCGDMDDGDVAGRAARFNDMALTFSQAAGTNLQLAVPRLRCAKTLPLEDVVYLRALASGENPVDAMLAETQRQGTRILDGEKPVTDPARRRKIVAENHRNWLRQRVPVLARMGIVGFVEPDNTAQRA